jgi:hypothetical protein
MHIYLHTVLLSASEPNRSSRKKYVKTTTHDWSHICVFTGIRPLFLHTVYFKLMAKDTVKESYNHNMCVVSSVTVQLHSHHINTL